MTLYEAMELEPAEQRVRELRAFVDGMAKGHCPTCGTVAVVAPSGEVIDIRPRIEESRNALQELEPQVKQARKELNEYWDRRRNTKAEHEMWTQAVTHKREQLTYYREELAKLPPVNEQDASDAVTAVDVYEGAKKHLKGLQAEIEKLAPVTASSETELKNLQSRLEKLQSLLPVKDVSPAQGSAGRLRGESQQARQDQRPAGGAT
jgi:chromosome segregation ATPase